jgi:pSer/pThr/pTyr-binding forkhead associated (FHA) protein
MAALGYIEVIDGRSRVVDRYRVHALPLTIGRAYSNHIILDDPYVSPEHLKIVAEDGGQLWADDLNSVNGLRASPGGRRVARLPLISGTPFQIGHTVLRYVDLEASVAPAMVDVSERVLRWPPWILGPASLLVLLMALLLEYYFESYERFNLARSFSESLTTLSIVFTWAALWSLLSRVILSRFYYAEHFALACAAILISVVFNISAEWTEFLFPSVPGLWMASVFGSGALIAGLVFGHLGWASTMLRRSRLWSALAASAAVIGTGVIAEYAGRDTFSVVMDYSSVIKPLESRWVPRCFPRRISEERGKT